MDLLKDLKMSLLIFSFAMINIIHKMLVLFKNHLNYLSTFEYFLRSIIDSFFLIFFLKHLMLDSLILEEENIIKGILNLFRLNKELNYTVIKDTRNRFRLEKETKAMKDRILRDDKNLFGHEEKL